VQGKSRSKLWILALIPIVAIPIENQYSIQGFSVAKLTMVPLALAVLAFRLPKLVLMLKHPIIKSGMVFIGWCSLCELFHPYADLEFIYRVVQVFAFSALLAVVASDKHSLNNLLLAIAAACAVIAIYLVVNFYGAVSADVETAREAGRVRRLAFEDMSLTANLNVLAYTAGMGAIVALPKFLLATKTLTRISWAVVYVLCFVGCLIPLSRGAMVAVLAGSALVLFRNFASSIKPRRIVLVIAVVALLYTLTPDALTTRFATIGQNASTEKPDSRAGVTMAAIKSLPEYWAVGVGSGNYWNNWAIDHGFWSNPITLTGTLGPHNGFLAAWIYFGLPGLLLLCWICLVTAHHRPRRSNKSWEASAIMGLAVLGLVWLMFTHNLYLKAFGVILGLVIAMSRENKRRQLPVAQ
jgi:hypothetical protein